MAVISIKNKTKSGSLLAGNQYYVPPSFESIATATGTGSSDTITFSSIPSTYKHLQVRVLSKGTASGSAGANDLYMNFNSDTTSTNYRTHALYGDGSSAGAQDEGNSGSIRVERAVQTSYFSNANMMGVAIIDIHDYASTSKNKTTMSICGTDTNGTATNMIWLSSGLWMSTSAINSITFKSTGTGSFTTSTVISLYGIAG